MNLRTGRINVGNASVSVWEDSVDEDSFMPVYGSLVKHLRSRGFRVVKDPEVKKRSPCISIRYHYAKKGDLEAVLHLSGRVIEIEFFQNIANVKNSNGGRYDLDRFERMPYLLKKQFILESAKIVDFMVVAYGYELGNKLSNGKSTVTRIIMGMQGINKATHPLESFNHQWGADRFQRDESGWPVASSYDNCGYNKDRDGVPLRNGMTRYHRDKKGYLRKGVVYTNMNTMWQLIFGKGRNDCTWVSCWELFSMQPGESFRKSIATDKQINRLEAVLGGLVIDQNFERAILVRNKIRELKSGGAA